MKKARTILAAALILAALSGCHSTQPRDHTAILPNLDTYTVSKVSKVDVPSDTASILFYSDLEEFESMAFLKMRNVSTAQYYIAIIRATVTSITYHEKAMGLLEYNTWHHSEYRCFDLVDFQVSEVYYEEEFGEPYEIGKYITVVNDAGTLTRREEYTYFFTGREHSYVTGREYLLYVVTTGSDPIKIGVEGYEAEGYEMDYLYDVFRVALLPFDLTKGERDYLGLLSEVREKYVK